MVSEGEEPCPLLPPSPRRRPASLALLGGDAEPGLPSPASDASVFASPSASRAPRPQRPLSSSRTRDLREQLQ